MATPSAQSPRLISLKWIGGIHLLLYSLEKLSFGSITGFLEFWVVDDALSFLTSISPSYPQTAHRQSLQPSSKKPSKPAEPKTQQGNAERGLAKHWLTNLTHTARNRNHTKPPSYADQSEGCLPSWARMLCRVDAPYRTVFNFQLCQFWFALLVHCF